MMSNNKVNESCWAGLETLRKDGLLKCNEDNTTLCSSWPSTVQFNEDGYVTLLDFGGKRLYKGWPSSFDILQTFEHLTTLNLSGTDLPLEDALKILSFVGVGLKHLFLGGNGYQGLEAGQALGKWVSSSSAAKNLVKFDLRFNDMGELGIESLCEGLMSTKIEFLYLEGNHMGNQGAIAISKVLLRQHPTSTIKELFLGSNQIQSPGAISIASSLKENKVVRKIYLEGNTIGVQGADAFATVLEELNGNTGLKNLFVDNNTIGKEGSKRLANALNSATAIGESLE